MVLIDIGEIVGLDHAREMENRPEHRLVALDGTGVLVLSRLESEGDVSEIAQMLHHGSREEFFEAEDQRCMELAGVVERGRAG